MICDKCVHNTVCGIGVIYNINDCDNFFELIRCEDCKHSIKKDYNGVVSHEYLCIRKSTITHLEEHEGNYFCADGERKEDE